MGFTKSKPLLNGQYMTGMAGFPYYVAPEVIEGNYNESADIWSLGVLLYTLVSGYLPFQGKNTAMIFERIRLASSHFNHSEFSQISEDCKDLIR